MSDSSSEEERDRKERKRQRSQSYSPRDRRKQKKHKKHRHQSSDGEDDSRHKQGRRERGHQQDRRHREEKYDPHKRIKQEPTDDNFREQRRERARNDERRQKARRRRERDDDDGQFEFGQGRRTGPAVKKEPKEKEKPNFEVSGKLTEDTNTYRGVVIKYNEPPEARKPRRRWRLYPFKGEEVLPVLHIHRQSAYLLGRDRRVADIPVDHPSCSKQHAVLQFRLVDFQRSDGTMGKTVKPYVLDLGSANGTFVNNKQIEAQRYVELLEKDVIKFGFSTREYVLLHEKADTSDVIEHSDSS